MFLEVQMATREGRAGTGTQEAVYVVSAQVWGGAKLRGGAI